VVAKVVAHEERTTGAQKRVVELLERIGPLEVDLALFGGRIVSRSHAGKGARPQVAPDPELPASGGCDGAAKIKRVQFRPAARSKTLPVVHQARAGRAAEPQLPLAGIRGHAAGQLQLDDPDVIILSRIQVAGVVGRDPQEPEASMPRPTEGEMLATIPLQARRQAIAPLDVERVQRL
jgi:hypothetical protein